MIAAIVNLSTAIVVVLSCLVALRLAAASIGVVLGALGVKRKPGPSAWKQRTFRR